MARTFGQSVPLEKSQPKDQPKDQAANSAPAPIPRLRPSRFGTVVLVAAVILALFWIGIGGAFLWGYLGPQGIAALDLSHRALAAAGVFLPPFLFLAMAAALARSVAMSDATKVLLAASDRLFAADEVAANNAARLARVVRRELDGLNTGLDVAFQRMRTLEAVLEKQISTLDDAGARAQVRSETIVARLQKENTRIESLGDHLTEAAGRAGESVAGRAAQLKATMEIGGRHAEDGDPVAGCAGGGFSRRDHGGVGSAASGRQVAGSASRQDLGSFRCRDGPRRIRAGAP